MFGSRIDLTWNLKLEFFHLSIIILFFESILLYYIIAHLYYMFCETCLK